MASHGNKHAEGAKNISAVFVIPVLGPGPHSCQPHTKATHWQAMATENKMRKKHVSSAIPVLDPGLLMTVLVPIFAAIVFGRCICTV